MLNSDKCLSFTLCSAGSDSFSATVTSSGPTESSSASSFNRYTDSPAVEKALREGCLACIRHILSSIRSELVTASPDPSPARLSSVLFMARLCQSMGELCPNLKHCILGKQSGSEAMAKGTPRQGKKLGKARAATEVSPAQAKWAGLKEELLDCSMEAYRIWSSALSKVRHCQKCRCIYVKFDLLHAVSVKNIYQPFFLLPVLSLLTVTYIHVRSVQNSIKTALNNFALLIQSVNKRLSAVIRKYIYNIKSGLTSQCEKSL